jgi:hypothetical protein
MDRRLGGSQSQSGHGGEEKNSQPLSGLEPPIIQPVAQHYTTKLSQLILLFCTYKNFSQEMKFMKCTTEEIKIF